jgi:hypothetical protein
MNLPARPSKSVSTQVPALIDAASFLLRTVDLLRDRSESAFCDVVRCRETHALSQDRCAAATAAVHRAEPNESAGRYTWATIFT